MQVSHLKNIVFRSTKKGGLKLDDVPCNYKRAYKMKEGLRVVQTRRKNFITASLSILASFAACPTDTNRSKGHKLIKKQPNILEPTYM